MAISTNEASLDLATATVMAGANGAAAATARARTLAMGSALVRTIPTAHSERSKPREGSARDACTDETTMTTTTNTLIESTHPFLGRRILVRSDLAGVYSGTLVGICGTQIHMRDGKHYWEWEANPGAVALCGMAMVGGHGRSDAYSEIVISEYVSLIPVADGVEL